MRSLIISLFFIVMGSLPIDAANRKCKELSKNVEVALDAQRTLTQKRITGPLREQLNHYIDSGHELDPEFFRQLYTNKTFNPNNFKVRNKNQEHVKEHMESLGATTTKRYEKLARAFAKSTDREIINFTSDKEIFRFNPATNQYMILDKSTKDIVTYFKPDLKVINARREINGKAPFRTTLEWIVENKWKRYH